MGHSLQIFHTADWHLGHTLHGLSQKQEHDIFIDWLLKKIVNHQPDALLIAGDVFDQATPSIEATEQYYSFLAEMTIQAPNTQIILIAGNHDSGIRLEAPRELLKKLKIHVIGHALREHASYDDRDLNQLCIPITRSTGEVLGIVAAAPFLRRKDLRLVAAHSTTQDEEIILGHKRFYEELYNHACSLKKGLPRDSHEIPIIAMGHLYLSGTSLSELSERKIQIGNQCALSADIFPSGFNYIALGHLHQAQSIANFAHIRYSGSPIPLSFTEKNYEHQVLRIEFENNRIRTIEKLKTPHARQLFQIPEEGQAPGLKQSEKDLGEQIRSELLEKLPSKEASPLLEPWFELRLPFYIERDHILQIVHEVLKTRMGHLLRVHREKPNNFTPHKTTHLPKHLELSTPLEIFEILCMRRTGLHPPSDLLRCFEELVEEVDQDCQ